MTIRSEKHVMEDESKNIIQSFLLPWIVYDLRVSDYAIDLYIRIAELNKPVSSETFHIQLKSTKDLNLKKNRIALNNFPTKSLKTFEASFEPIYIVLCDLNSKKLYWVNAHDEINRLNNTNPKWKKQKTNTIYFDSPQAEFTKLKLKEDVIRIRKKLIIKHSIKLKEEESFENLYKQLEIETIQEDVFSGKIELKDENLIDFFIADLNFFKIFNIENDDAAKRIKETEITISLYKKIIKHKKIPSDFNIGLLYMRVSDLFFILSGTRDYELNIKNSIDFNKKALNLFDKKEDTLQYFIINYNMGLSYKLLYEKDSKDEYLLIQIAVLNNILELADEQGIFPIMSQIHLSIANLYQKLTDKKMQLIENKLIIVQQIKTSIKHFEKALEYSQYSKDSKEDALINISIGILFGMMAEFENPHANLKDSARYLKKGYDIILTGGNLEEISDLKTKLGVIYRGLYKYEKNKDCFKKSIKYLNQALEFWNLKDFPWEYATVMKNLAMIYTELGNIENTIENIAKAINALEEVSKVFTIEESPERYASTQLAYFEVYMTLYYKKNKSINNLEKALKSLNQCLKIYTKDFYPYGFATAKLNLGATYMHFYEYSKKKEYIEKSIESSNEAIEIFTLDDYPEDYAKTQNNCGQSYIALSKYKDEKSNLKNAINSFKESLKVRSLASHPFKYALTNSNLGIAYYKRYKLEGREDLLEKGIKTYNNALKNFTFEDYPEQYAEAHFNLGGYYRKLAENNDKTKNLKRAISHFRESLKIRTLDSNPFEYRITNYYIGEIYFELIEIEEKEEYIEKSLDAFSNMLKILSKTEEPQNYASIQYNLGNLYVNLAKFKEIKINLEKAIIAFIEVIRIYYERKSYEQLKEVAIRQSRALYLYSKLNEKDISCLYAIKGFNYLKKKVSILKDKELDLEISNCLGIIFRKLSKFSNKKENLEKAIDYYKISLKIVETGSENHGLILNNLGLAYLELADVSDESENLRKALLTYKDSLQHLTKKKNKIINKIKQEIQKIEQKLKH